MCEVRTNDAMMDICGSGQLNTVLWGGKAQWRYSGLKVLMKSYLKLLFKCNTNRGVFTGNLAERVECGPSNHVVEGSIPCTVTFFFIFFQLFFLIFSFFSKKKSSEKEKKIASESLSHDITQTIFCLIS